MSLEKVEQGMTRVHLDFHTSPHIKKIADRFDPGEFASTLADARVDSVVVFAKCHHGYSYYDTKIGTRHPGLDFDLLGEMITVCHKRGILTPVYYSVAWEELVAQQHPDWRQVDADGTPRDKSPSEEWATGGWATICFNSPYVEEILIPQTEEILRNYEADGLWYDIVGFRDESCYCKFCRDKMTQRGLDPENEEHQRSFTRQTIREFVERTSTFARRIRPNLSLDYNGRVGIGSREHVPFVTNIEIEALPSTVGYLYFPVMSRHMRTFGLPVSGLTCRFIRMWGDFGTLKPEAQLQYEAAVMLSSGARISIGDQLHPDGELRKPAYDLIGRVFSEVHTRRKWCEGAEPITNIALFAQRRAKKFGVAMISDALRGAATILLELHHQFDVIDEQVPLDSYDLLILPGPEEFSSPFLGRLEDFIAHGGKILATAQAAFPLGPILGVEASQLSANPREYIRPRGKLAETLPPIDHVVYGPPVHISAPNARVLADLIPPYFPRSPEKFCSHRQTPPVTDPPTRRPALTLSEAGAYIAPPLFASYAFQPNPHLRKLVHWLLANLTRPLVATNLPASVDVSLMRKESDTILHIVSGPAPREARLVHPLEEFLSHQNVWLSVSLPRKPARVYLAPDGTELQWKWEGGRAEVQLQEVGLHTMLIFEAAV